MGLFTAVFWLFFIATSAVFFAVSLTLFLVTFPFDRRRVVVHQFGCFWASFYTWINPLWTTVVVGREKLPWKAPAILVANHLSLLDILVLYRLFRPFKWVAKAEVFRAPLIGWHMKLCGYVALRRGDRDSIRQMMADCRAHIDEGSPMLIFPEGTRSEDGRLQAFKDGAFRLACEKGCLVYPIAISGTFDALPKTGWVLRERMRARVEVLDPLDPKAFGSDLSALREAARSAIAAALPTP